jgi:hypothetical protein
MIALYKGRSLISRCIRLFTWSQYSHAAWIDAKANLVIEAWSGRVRMASSLSELHTPGTPVDVFFVDVTPEQDTIIAAFMHSQVGKAYDYRGIVHFITRRPETGAGQARWFCSELVHAAYRAAGIQLLSRVPDYKVSPGTLSYSPLLKHICSIVTGARGKAPARPAEQGVLSAAPECPKSETPSIAVRAEGIAETPEEWPV